MRLIGGVVSADRERTVTPATLRGMAGAMPGAGAPVYVAKGPAGLLTVGGEIESDPTVWAVGDLDLTNLPELRALTGHRGERGLLSALYSLEGPEFVRRLRGGFALAVLDRRQRRLLLAVDRFGIKRLYYSETPEGVAFASRASSLAAGNGAAAVDPTAVYQYLNFGYVPAPCSIYAGVRRLPAGQLLLAGEGRGAELRRYWELTYPERPIGVRQGAGLTYRLLEEAVALALRGTSGKETGCFLSGGTDSSTIVGLAGAVTGERVHAFSIGFRESGYDEMGYAEAAARHFDAVHHVAVLTPDLALDALPRVLAGYDEPFGNGSSLPTYFCAQLASRTGMRLLLAGDGGDELFGGNERYRTDRIFAVYAKLPAWLRRRLLEPALSAVPADGNGVLARARRYVRRASIPNPRRFYSYEFLVAAEAGQLLRPEFAASIDTEAPWHVLEEHYSRAPATSELNRLLYLDVKLTLADNDLLKVTRAADLAGIVVRFPMLDHPLAEFTGTLPARYKVRGLEKRYLFKRAFRRLLPAEVLEKRKHGFGVPLSAWLRSHAGFRSLAREALLSPGARVREYFRDDVLPRLFALHEADSTPYYGDLLWTFLMFELWHAEHRRHVAAA